MSPQAPPLTAEGKGSTAAGLSKEVGPSVAHPVLCALYGLELQQAQELGGGGVCAAAI